MSVPTTKNIALFLAMPMVLASALSQAAMITYGPSGWITNDGATGNYILTINDNTPNKFTYNITVDPWNAEVSGLFIDLGNVDVGGDVGLSDVSPTGQVILFDTDTSSNSCGAGCNVKGLNPPLAGPDNEWEMVFRLADQGFDNIQSFSFATNRFGLDLSDFATVAFRAQQLCNSGQLLPGDEASCTGGDKAYLTGPNGGGTTDIPEPGILSLLGIGFVGLGWMRRRSIA